MPDKNNFAEIFRKLKAIFKPHEKKMVVVQSTDSSYMLNTRHIMKNKQPLCFGGVRLGPGLRELLPDVGLRLAGRDERHVTRIEEANAGQVLL